MTLDLQGETLIRGPDGVLYRVSAGQSVPVTEPVSHDSVSLDATHATGHSASRIMTEPGDFAAMDHGSSRIHIEPGDLTPSRLTVDPAQV